MFIFTCKRLKLDGDVAVSSLLVGSLHVSTAENTTAAVDAGVLVTGTLDVGGGTGEKIGNGGSGHVRVNVSRWVSGWVSLN